MSIFTKLPPRTLIRPVSARFSATYNATTPFLYDFNIPANVLNLTATKKQRVYLLEQFDFDVNIPREEYQTAIGTNAEPFLKLSYKKQNSAPIYFQPWPLTSFKQNKEHVVFFESPVQSDNIQATYRAQLNQTAFLVAIPTIIATWSAILYEVSNKDWIRQYLRPTSSTIGRDLRT